MTNDAFGKRRQALEDEFFHRVDQQLLEKATAKIVAESNREQLEAATGISDEDLLNELLAAGATSESVAAISLVPLVLVAWSDGKMDPKEREPIMEAAKHQSIASGSPAAQLLEHWLAKKPQPTLAIAWKHYVACVISKMSDEAVDALRADILQGADAVAKAAGGTFGFGKVSAEEKRVIAELEQALKRTNAPS